MWLKLDYFMPWGLSDKAQKHLRKFVKVKNKRHAYFIVNTLFGAYCSSWEQLNKAIVPTKAEAKKFYSTHEFVHWTDLSIPFGQLTPGLDITLFIAETPDGFDWHQFEGVENGIDDGIPF